MPKVQLKVNPSGFQSYLRRRFPKVRNITVSEFPLSGKFGIRWETGGDKVQEIELHDSLRKAGFKSK